LHIERAFEFVWFCSVWFFYFLAGLLFLRVLVFLFPSLCCYVCIWFLRRCVKGVCILAMVNDVFVLFLPADKKHWYCVVTIILLMIGTGAR
jgi:hypothetical protein